MQSGKVKAADPPKGRINCGVRASIRVRGKKWGSAKTRKKLERLGKTAREFENITEKARK